MLAAAEGDPFPKPGPIEEDIEDALTPFAVQKGAMRTKSDVVRDLLSRFHPPSSEVNLCGLAMVFPLNPRTG